MRRLSIAALMAAPLLLFAAPGGAVANPVGTANFGCGGYCFKLFPHMHQHGPLFNYGPYYGYYPFAPYGPWDAYLRYDPNFYGYSYKGHGHCHSCSSGGFLHASWLQGGWFRGHTWFTGCHSCGHKSGAGASGACSSCNTCSSCGGVSTAKPVAHSGDATFRYNGVGSPAQSALFYSATPTLDPALELIPTGGRTK